MAELHKRDDREDWLKWAIEFMKRGLWADDYITVHGPHSSADYMWGEADASWDGTGRSVQCIFETARGIRSIHDLRGVRIVDAEDRSIHYPIQNVSDLTPKAQRWLRNARLTQARLRGIREEEEKKIAILQNRMRENKR
jgi:hypothetical protein